MNDLQNTGEPTEGTICGFCEGEGEHVVHFALDSAENIYETCPICKGKGVRTMNDLQNALEQLKRGISEQRGIAIFPREAQALLDERDALLEALETLVAYVENRKGHAKPYAPAMNRARAALPKHETKRYNHAVNGS